MTKKAKRQVSEVVGPAPESARVDAAVLSVATLLRAAPHWSYASPLAMRQAAAHLRGPYGDDPGGLLGEVARVFEATAAYIEKLQAPIDPTGGDDDTA